VSVPLSSTEFEAIGADDDEDAIETGLPEIEERIEMKREWKNTPPLRMVLRGSCKSRGSRSMER
jgi:hypothetical protein